jgi:hypothetical protein
VYYGANVLENLDTFVTDFLGGFSLGQVFSRLYASNHVHGLLGRNHRGNEQEQCTQDSCYYGILEPLLAERFRPVYVAFATATEKYYGGYASGYYGSYAYATSDGGESFDGFKERIALIISAVLAADEKADITVEQMTDAETWQQAQDIIKAYVAVMELSAKFFNIPEVEPKDEKPAEETEDEEKAKN